MSTAVLLSYPEGCISTITPPGEARNAWFGMPVDNCVALSPTTTPRLLIPHPMAERQLPVTSVPRLSPAATVVAVRNAEFENAKEHAAVLATCASPVTCPDRLMSEPKLLDVPSNVPRSVNAMGTEFPLDR